ncbi:MAG: hypothetical protein FJ010_01240 [Chloroflexi bacterium]|nr:hypothetical protein [Chloroflexota bacterium]
MDILHLVDRLEELFNESRPIPLTHNVIVDEDRMLDLIDQMRVTIPEEVKRAQQVLTQRDRILAQAQEEAKRTVDLAREKSQQLVERDAVVLAAKARAEDVIKQAGVNAEHTRREADNYVIQTLSRIEAELERLLNQARNGIMALQNISEQETNPEPESNLAGSGLEIPDDPSAQ